MSLLLKTCAAILVSVTAINSLGQSEFDGEQAQMELESVATAIEDIRQWLTNANQTETKEEQALRETEQELTALDLLVTSTQSDIDDVRAELALLENQAQQLQTQKSSQTSILSSLLKSIYINGEPSLLKSIFSQNDLSDSARMLHYTSKLSESQIQKIQTFEMLLAEIAEVESATQANLAQLNQQSSTLADQLATLDLAKSKKETALAELRASIAAKGDELQQLEVNQTELQRLVEEIRIAMEGVRSFADVPPIQEAKGQLAAPVNGRVSSRFGERYGDGNLSRQGITLQTQTGTPVQAIHAGHVVFADWLRGSGLLVIVDHGDGYMSLYGSNEALSASAGTWVDAGDVLATSGTAINSGEPGLYFEIRHHGQPQDPAQWLEDIR